MALPVLQGEAPVGARDELRLDVTGPGSRRLPWPPTGSVARSPGATPASARTAAASAITTAARSSRRRRKSRRTVVQSPGAPPPMLSAGSTMTTGPPTRRASASSRAASRSHSRGTPASRSRQAIASRRSRWRSAAASSPVADERDGNARVRGVGVGVAGDHVDRPDRGVARPRSRAPPLRGSAWEPPPSPVPGRRPDDRQRAREHARPPPRDERAREKLGGEGGGVEGVAVRVLAIGDEPVGVSRHGGREGGVEVEHAEDRQRGEARQPRADGRGTRPPGRASRSSPWPRAATARRRRSRPPRPGARPPRSPPERLEHGVVEGAGRHGGGFERGHAPSSHGRAATVRKPSTVEPSPFRASSSGPRRTRTSPAGVTSSRKVCVSWKRPASRMRGLIVADAVRP